jgi:hypothetical protein
MKTFDLNRTINGVGDLSDGVLIAMCLKNMFVLFVVRLCSCGFLFSYVYLSSDGNHFNETWLQKLRNDAGDNYRIKVGSIRRLPSRL